MRYNLTCKGEHLFVALPEGIFLVDTGSPTSFSRLGRLSFARQTETVPTSAMGMLDADELSGYVGVNVDGLIGMNLLARHMIVFDDDKMFVDECPIPDHDFTLLESDSFMGIPIVSIRIAGQNVKMFLDSGAKLSYLDADYLKSFPVDETLPDFYPGIGRFTVDVSAVPCEIAGFHVPEKFGRLPSILQATLMIGGVHGILGHDFFARFRVGLKAGGSSVLIAQLQEASSVSNSIVSTRCWQSDCSGTDHQRKGATIHFETDDIFDNMKGNAYHGIALVVPLGLTAFRVLASDFVKKNGKLLSEDRLVKVFGVDHNKCGSLIRIVEVQTPRFKPFCKDDVTTIVEKVLAVLDDAGCMTIGMNGIKIGEDNRSHNCFLSEQTTVDAVRNWCRQHTDSTIRDVYLVDKRGGFGHVDSANTITER